MKQADKLKIKELYATILSIENSEDIGNFFRDLMTEKELIEMGNRWKAARMLAVGISYVEIEKETGLSSRTIARVSKWLNQGMGGYKSLIEKYNKLNHHNSFPPGKELS
jgi:TrpR-related protein YerC/YecD